MEDEFKKPSDYDGNKEAQNWFDEISNPNQKSEDKSEDKEVKKEEEEEEENDEDENEEKIPFHKNPKFAKRIKEANEKNDRLEEELSAYKSRLEKLEDKPTDDTIYDDPLYNKFHKLYFNGSNEEDVKSGWIEQNSINKALIERAQKQFEETLSKNESQSQQLEKQLAREIETNLSKMEEDYGIDMSDNKTRNTVLGIYEKLSSKDKNGNITSLADIELVNEWYTLKSKSTPNPKTDAKKDIANKSIQKGGTGSEKAKAKPIPTINSDWRDLAGVRE